MVTVLVQVLVLGTPKKLEPKDLQPSRDDRRSSPLVLYTVGVKEILIKCD